MAGGPNLVVRGLILALPLLLAGGLLIWNEVATPSCTAFDASVTGEIAFDAPPCSITSREYLYFAELRTSAGPIRLVLDPIVAPKAVNNFVFLAKAGFYDGIVIHKVESTDDHAFVQIGDRSGTGRGTAGYMFESDPPSPVARYVRGVAAMVFAGDDPRTAGSQFFIVVDDYETLSYPARQPVNTLLGKVIDQESLDTLDSIVALPVVEGRPIEAIVIDSVEITQTDRFTADQSPTPTPTGS